MCACASFYGSCGYDRWRKDDRRKEGPCAMSADSAGYMGGASPKGNRNLLNHDILVGRTEAPFILGRPIVSLGAIGNGPLQRTDSHGE